VVKSLVNFLILLFLVLPSFAQTNGSELEETFLDRSKTILDNLKKEDKLAPVEIPTESPTVQSLTITEKKVQEKINKKTEEIHSEKKDLYLDLLKKSLLSLEKDSWEEAKVNVEAVLAYFRSESLLFGDLPKPYFDFSRALMKFVQAGLELDRNKDVDLLYVKSIYDRVLLDLQMIKNSFPQQEQEFIDMVSKLCFYTEEEIEYIKNLLESNNKSSNND
jgi:hypothetical protein